MSAGFASRLLHWFDIHGRHDLPWQHPRNAYRVWLAEIMLQQTQVTTVIPYFLRFVEKFTNIHQLAATSLDEILALWSGLGYYNRARNLHRAAQLCVEHYQGELPQNFDALIALPGIGASTAGAILAQAFNQHHAILDGNVKRVLTRFHGIAGWPGAKQIENQLWKFAQMHTPRKRVADYTQAIMDLGATVCARAQPRCIDCPLAGDCIAYRDDATARLPTPRPARAVPTRHTIMLVLRDVHGRLLLERRAPSGVWPGLWSLPEADDETTAQRMVRNVDQDRVKNHIFKPLPVFTHGFTHYRLEIAPLMVEIRTHAKIADANDGQWFSLKEAAELGLPAPVRKLIANL